MPQLSAWLVLDLSERGDQGVRAGATAWLCIEWCCRYRKFMARIVYETATSVDGYIADDQHSLSWLFAVPGGDDPQLAPPQAAVQVMGSTTYEWVLAELDALKHPEMWHKAFGQRLIVVFTSKPRDAPDGSNVEFYSGDVIEALPALRRAAQGGVMWIVGGGQLAVQFIEAKALNELVLTIAPAALGAGAPLLPTRLESNQLTLTSAHQVGQFARLTYEISYPA